MTQSRGTLLRDAKLIWSLLRRHRLHFFLAVGMVVLSSGIMGAAMSFILPVVGEVFDWDVGVETGGFFAYVKGLFSRLVGASEHRKLISVAFIFGMMLFNACVQFGVIYINSGLTAKITFDCRRRVYDTVHALQFREFLRFPRGALIQVIVAESRSIYTVMKHLLTLMGTVLNVTVILTLLVLFSWKLTVVTLIGFAATLGVSFLVTRTIKRLSKRALDLRAALTAQVSDSIQGVKQVRLLGAESRVGRLVSRVSRSLVWASRSLKVRQSSLPVITQTMGILVFLAIVVTWMSVPVFPAGRDPAAGIVTFVILITRLSPFVAGVSKNYGSLMGNLPVLTRIGDFLAESMERERDGTVERTPLLQSMISIQGVSIAYAPDKPVLQGLCMDIARGSYVGLCGPSGGGKTTLFHLLTRIYDPDEGSIRMDGTDLRDLRLSSLRRGIGLVSQDFFLFNATIRENLLLAKPDAEDAELWAALGKAGLRDFVESEEQGLDSAVGNNGERLSGGQRQRLSLAVQFLRDPEVIILDEGTSSVDKETERHILNSVRELHASGRTVICSAHKETALADADCVYELRDGQMAAVR